MIQTEFLKDVSYEILETEFPHLPTTYVVEELAQLAYNLNPYGLFLEFGTYKGGTINRIARQLPNVTVHGFDTFRGLPKTWVFNSRCSIGRQIFDVKGQLPEVEPNVVLHEGLFSVTLPKMIKDTDKISFLHIDCDLYESTVDVFKYCEDKLLDGAILAFDEIGCGYGDYENWKDGEAKAFIEMIQRTGYKWRMLCRDKVDTNPGAIQIKVSND